MLILLNNLSNLIKQSSIQSNRVQSQITKFLIFGIKFIFGSFLPRIWYSIDFNTGLLGYHSSYVAYTAGFGDLIEYFDTVALVGWVGDSDFDAACGIGDMDESASLATGAVDGEWDSHGALEEEAVEDGAVVTIVVEAVDEAFVLCGLGCVGAPDYALVEVCYAELVVFLVELPEEGVEAFGGVVDAAWVGWVQDVGFTTVGEGYVDVALWNLSAGAAVAIDSHRS